MGSASQFTSSSRTSWPNSSSPGPITTSRVSGRIATTYIGARKPPGRPRPRVALRQPAHRRQQARHDGVVDAPQEVRLVLLRVAAAVQGAVPGDHVMPGGDVAAVQGVRVVEKVSELGERVTAHAGDGRPAAGVLGDEVTDHVAEYARGRTPIPCERCNSDRKSTRLNPGPLVTPNAAFSLKKKKNKI